MSKTRADTLTVADLAIPCRCDKPLIDETHCVKCGREVPDGKRRAAERAAHERFERRLPLAA